MQNLSPQAKAIRLAQLRKMVGIVPVPVPIKAKSKRTPRKPQESIFPSNRGGGQMSGRANGLSVTAFSRNPRQSQPRQTEPLRGDEFIATVAGSTTFSTTSYSVNPGQVGVFPQGSVEAALWQKYRTRKLQFYYAPLGGPVATDTQKGRVVLSMNFDAAAPPPNSRAQVEDTSERAECFPYEWTELNISPKLANQNALTGLFVRPGYLPGGADIKSYDIGILSVSTDACPNTNTIGEIRVRYEFVLEQKILRNVGAPANNQVAVYQSTTTEAAGATTVFKQMVLATQTTNGIGAVNTAGSIVLPAGNYNLDGFITADNDSAAYSLFVDVRKNGTTVYNSAQLIGGYGGGAASPTSAPVTAWVSSNGTDAFTVMVKDVYGSGVETNSGYLRITAI